jgi:hypothetical protein
MPSFDVIHVVGNARSTIVKVGIRDYGGPTKHVLLIVWFDYFDNILINSNHKFKTFYHDIICKDERIYVVHLEFLLRCHH